MNQARVFIPSSLRHLTQGAAEATAEGKNVRAIIDDLERQYPGIRERLVQASALRPGMAVVVNGEAGTLGLLQPVPDGAEVHFLPAIGGG